jgi:CxxC motif-containing protein (DUF1111 family)
VRPRPLVPRLASIFILLIAINLTPSLHAQRQRPSGPKPPPPPPVHNPPPTVIPAAGEPLAGLTAAQREAFADGLEDFSDEEGVGDGLGPVFNERSCKACHSVPAIGGGSERTVTRFSRVVNGVFDPLANLGGSLMQDHAVGPQDGSPHTFQPESVPAVANLVVHRRSPPLFGLGLVDATPDADFISMAAMQSARRDPVAGRVSQVMNIRAGMTTVGKFGWKGQVPSIFQFAGDAYVNELGITSPDFPNESCPQGNCAELAAFNPFPGLNDDGEGPELLSNFMTLLAAPPRGPQNRDTDDGEKTFESIGCAACHVATLRSGSSPIAALDHKTYHPYSDFLLHDMGALGDGLEMGSAKGAEMRTAPLWGLRFITTFLHDGRATTLDQAILGHDGQARGARDRFAALNPAAKAKLIAFLKSL